MTRETMGSTPTPLKPCPFCGSTDVVDVNNLFRHVMCRGCRVYLMAVEGSPTAAWNRRAPSPEQPSPESGCSEVGE